jgi:hypothetical protein
LGEGLAVRFGERVAAHWVDEPVAKVSAPGSSSAVPKSLVVAYGMKDDVHASTGEPYSGF